MKKSKKLKLKKSVVNLMAMLMFYAVIIGGVVLVNYRFKQINANNGVNNNNLTQIKGGY